MSTARCPLCGAGPFDVIDTRPVHPRGGWTVYDDEGQPRESCPRCDFYWQPERLAETAVRA